MTRVRVGAQKLVTPTLRPREFNFFWAGSALSHVFVPGPSFITIDMEGVSAVDGRDIDLTSIVDKSLRGWARVRHLMYVADHVPALRCTASAEAAQYLQKHMWDVATFRRLCKQAGPALCVEDIEEWCTSTETHVLRERERLRIELNAYSTNRVQESARLAHHDLGDHYRKCGAWNQALEHYESEREFSTTNEHALVSYMSVMQTAYEAGEPTRVLACYDQAYTIWQALEGSLVTPSASDAWRTVLAAGYVSEAQPTSAATHRDVRARLMAWRTLAQWSLCDVRGSLPQPHIDTQHVEVYTDILGALQYAWYLVLWALCTNTPSLQRKRVMQVLEDPVFLSHTETVPAARTVLSAYLVSDWALCVHTLRNALPVWQSDPTIGVQRGRVLLDAVIMRLVKCHVQAYERVSLSSLTGLFGSNVSHMLIELIQHGALHARIDWACQVLEKEAPCLAPRPISDLTALRERMALVQRMSLDKQ